MKNPCDECIVRVNCTQVCFNKINYKNLLNDAVRRYKGSKYGSPVLSNRNFYLQYLKYTNLLDKNMFEIAQINIRKRELQK